MRYGKRFNLRWIHHKVTTEEYRYRKTIESSTITNKSKLDTSTTKVNAETIKLITVVAQACIKEWQSNPELRQWFYTTIKTTSSKLQTLMISSSTTVKQLWLGESAKFQTSKQDFVLLDDKESILQFPITLTLEHRARDALHLPKEGPLPEDWRILQFQSSDDVKTPKQLKIQFYKLCQTWHPDHFHESKQKELAEHVFLIINQAHLRIKNRFMIKQ